MTPDLYPKYDEKAQGVLPEKLRGYMPHASWNPYPNSDQNAWFSLPYFRPEAQQVNGARDRLLQHVHDSWRKKGNGLITKWWRSSQFF